MSRSLRRTPILGIAGGNRSSEKSDKRVWHRSLRCMVHRQLHKFANTTLDIEELQNVDVFAMRYHVSNIWSFAKDGKKFYQNFNANLRRK